MNSRATGRPAPRALVIVIRGLPVSFIGAYGNEWIRTPTLDRLATRGIVFEQHFSTSPSLTDAAAAMFGTDSDIIHRLNRAGVFTARIRTDATQSKIDGWVTDEVIESDAAPAHMALTRQATYRILESIPKPAPGLVWLEVDSLSPPWEPASRFVNYYFEPDEDDEKPVEPWTQSVPTSVADDDNDTLERLQLTFAALVSTVDRVLTRLLAGSRHRGFGPNALTIVTTDAGMSLGECGRVGRIAQIGESTVHLPLIVRRPNNEMAGLRIAGLTQQADVAATLAEFFGTEWPGDGKSLAPMMRGETNAIRNHLIIRNDEQSAVRTDDRLFITDDAGSQRLYVKPDDRWEVNNLAMKNEVDVEYLTALINPAAK